MGERRGGARIHVAARIELGTRNGAVGAELRDVSEGGARFLVGHSLGAVGEIVDLMLPLTEGLLNVRAQILRKRVSPEGYEFAVRFIDGVDREAMHEYLDGLRGLPGSPERRHPRIARRMEVSFGDGGDRRGTIENISEGGLSMVVDRPMAPGEEFDVFLPDEERSLLRARVVHQRQSPGERGVRIGVEFVSVRSDGERRLSDLIAIVLELF
jgi:hypothetical protein